MAGRLDGKNCAYQRGAGGVSRRPPNFSLGRAQRSGSWISAERWRGHRRPPPQRGLQSGIRLGRRVGRTSGNASGGEGFGRTRTDHGPFQSRAGTIVIRPFSGDHGRRVGQADGRQRAQHVPHDPRRSSPDDRRRRRIDRLHLFHIGGGRNADGGSLQYDQGACHMFADPSPWSSGIGNIRWQCGLARFHPDGARPKGSRGADPLRGRCLRGGDRRQAGRMCRPTRSPRPPFILRATTQASSAAPICSSTIVLQACEGRNMAFEKGGVWRNWVGISIAYRNTRPRPNPSPNWPNWSQRRDKRDSRSARLGFGPLLHAGRRGPAVSFCRWQISGRSERRQGAQANYRGRRNAHQRGGQRR